MVLDLEVDVALLPGSAVPEVQGALACHPGVEVPKSPGAAPADLVSLEAPATPEGPSSILEAEAPACLASLEDLSFPEGHVLVVRLEGEVLSSLEVGGPSSYLEEQDPDSPVDLEALVFLVDSVPSGVPETPDLGSLETLVRLVSREDEEVLAFLWDQVVPAFLEYQEVPEGPSDPGDQAGLEGLCVPVDQVGPEDPCDLEDQNYPAVQAALEVPKGHEALDAAACLGAHACPEAAATPGVGLVALVVP
ncbi:hypothetical protein TREES_T100013315 [Tupaia chinensis]|uniref:Uncharacterized protein n=1 Tax=Tupaia chinensis TaxID=246437 RepID=L9KM33_TUPCH|nr:hypothetical protein TREES_T100013315 [Tupaia chinensis]